MGSRGMRPWFEKTVESDQDSLTGHLTRILKINEVRLKQKEKIRKEFEKGEQPKCSDE